MRIDVPREFAACVRSLGGIVSDDVKGPNLPSNADYRFAAPAIVAELKCLSENLFDKAEFRQRTREMHASWVARGLMPPSPGAVVRLNLRDMPLECAREFIQYVKRRFESNIVRKANSQIKATKEQFRMPEAKGLLLLVNEGDYALPPDMTAHLFTRLRSDEHTSINSLVYFSENELVTVPGIPAASRLWMEAVLPEREPVSNEFLTRLRSAWFDHCTRLAPKEHDGGVVMMPNDPAVVDRIRFPLAP